MDIGALMNFRQAWGTFCANHPRFPDFIAAVRSKGITEGTEIKISVTYPDGQTVNAGLKLKQSDLELFKSLASAGR